MQEELKDGFQDDKNDKLEGKKPANQNWVVRCSQEQKEFFQKIVAQSGVTSSEFLYQAFLEFEKEKVEDKDLKEIVNEVKFFTRKLENIVTSHAIIAVEKKKLLEIEIDKAQHEQKNFKEAFNQAQEIAKNEFLKKEKEYIEIIEKEKEELEKKHELELNDLRNRLIHEVTIKEKEASLNEQLTKEILSLKNQIEHAKKYSHSLEEKNDDLARKLMETMGRNKILLEKENKYDEILEKNRELEKNLALSQAQIENEKLKARLEIQEITMNHFLSQNMKQNDGLKEN